MRTRINSDQFIILLRTTHSLCSSNHPTTLILRSLSLSLSLSLFMYSDPFYSSSSTSSISSLYRSVRSSHYSLHHHLRSIAEDREFAVECIQSLLENKEN